MLKRVLKNSVQNNKRFLTTNKFLFENKEKDNSNKKGLDFWFGEGEDNAHPNTKHYDLPKEEFGKYWQGMPSLYESAVGLERAEILDPFYFDELLPTFVDIETGAGSSREFPVIVPTMGQSERVVACFGDCGDPDVDPEDNEDEFRYWVGEEGTFSLCLKCGLHFYFASNEDIVRLNLDVQGRDIYTQPTLTKHYANLKEKLSFALQSEEKAEKITDKEYNDAIAYLDEAKEHALFNIEDIEKAKEYLQKYKSTGFVQSPKKELQRILDLVKAEEAILEGQKAKHRKYIELHRLEYALPRD